MRYHRSCGKTRGIPHDKPYVDRYGVRIHSSVPVCLLSEHRKVVHTGSVLKWRGGQRPASGLPVKEEPAEPREETSEEAVIGRSRYRLWQSPPMDEEYAMSEKRTDTTMKGRKAPVPEFPAPFGRPEEGEVPERYEITGYVERPDPHRARGVTFDDMDLLSRFMTTDRLSEPEQSHARQTLERLGGDRHGTYPAGRHPGQ